MTRTAADIGAGLAPARVARPIKPAERIHIVGAAGAGASAAALHAAWAGANVDGCDPGAPSPYTAALAAAGIPISDRHDAGHVSDALPGIDRLAVTKALTAIAPDHPELEAARAAGVPLEAWQQLVADAAAGRTLVAVAGTHGKSTSAGWLVHVLVSAGADPAAFVGALLPAELTGGTPATARRGGGGTFVVEADEYAGNFEPFRPALAVVTAVDWDHPDVFADRDAVEVAFEGWLRRAGEGSGRPPTLVANVADPGVAAVLDRLGEWPGRLVATALVEAAPQRVGSYASGIAERFRTSAGPAIALVGRLAGGDPAGTRIELHLGDSVGPRSARLALAGRHNAANALGVAGAAIELGLAVPVVTEALGSYRGVGRRLERKGEAAGVVVYDDYAHHPTAIRATIGALRQLEPGRRLWAVHEPLTFHRTAALLGDLAGALALADAVVVADIWPGRDPDTTIASAEGVAATVARLAPRLPIAAPGSVEAAASWLADEVRSGDAVLVMGGGRSYRIGELLLAALADR